MAIMIPSPDRYDETKVSIGEMHLYELMRQLPDEYYVFHSLEWEIKRKAVGIKSYNRPIWGEADFTVFHPKYGIIVFEVKDGNITLDPENGWQQTNTVTGYQKIIDPLHQARKSMYYFLEGLEDKYGKGTVPYTLCAAVCFTMADRNDYTGTLPHAYHNDIILFSNDIESVNTLERGIKRIYAFHGAREQWHPTEELTSEIVNFFAPCFGAFESVRSHAILTRRLFHRMTQEQLSLLDYLSEQQDAAIHGVAGTGKTVLAVQKAFQLSEDAPVLFLCFNSFLRQHLHEAYGTHKNVDFYTLDALLKKYTGKFIPDPNQRFSEIVSFLSEWSQYDIPYKHIIVDEGQDFWGEHLELLHIITQINDGCFYVFYDRHQFVQGAAYPEWLDHMECRLVLSRNCRNTREIALTSTRPIRIDDKKIKMRRDQQMLESVLSQPTLFLLSDYDQLKEYLAKLIQKYLAAGIAKENIVVLSMKSAGGSILIPEDFRLSKAATLSTEKEQGTVWFTTCRKFKGLEAEAVICIDIDADTFRQETDRSVFYVGTSRATTYLDMITIADPQELATAISEDGIKRSLPQSRKTIREKLCVRLGREKDLL